MRILKPGDPDTPTGTIIVREVNPLDTFNLPLMGSGGESWHHRPESHCHGCREAGIQQNAEMFRRVKLGATEFPRYSKKALDALRPHVPEIHGCMGEASPVA